MRPPASLPIRATGGRDCQAIRRSSSKSTTSLTIEYGMPSFIDIPNLDPRERRWEPSFASRTVPDPSMSWCRDGSARRSKIADAGAGMRRSTVATSFVSVMSSTVLLHMCSRRSRGERAGGRWPGRSGRCRALARRPVVPVRWVRRSDYGARRGPPRSGVPMPLDPAAQQLLTLLAELGDITLESMTPDDARASYALLSASSAADLADVASVAERDIAGVPCRIVTPHGDGP